MRLNRIEGQIKGIQKMVEDDRKCKDILSQVNAASSALDSIAGIILQEHANNCVEQCIQSNSKESIEELIELMKKFIKR